jgi:tetratricopeptide (TPR) repeat protein
MATDSAPAPRPAITEEGRSRDRGRQAWEVVLCVLVLTFAFLAASFVARNSDVWLHLATGRLLAQGQYSFGADPFAYTTADVYWANHSWLYDLTLFLLYKSAGGSALVVLKATLIAGLAGIMLLFRGPGKSGVAPAFCTVLAVLVLAPRLLLQPICVSFALLGLTLWILWGFRASRPRLLGREVDARTVMIPLCALWVNLDEWFLLGPIMVFLFFLGDCIQPASARKPGERPTPKWLFLACWLACLCSPHHYHAFALPADLAPGLSYGALLQDVRFQRLSASLWQLNSYLYPSAGFNTAAAAYVVLVALGVVSFALNRSGLRDWRILVWGAFFLLGAWQVRLIPFFAVVAGPIAVLNLHGLKYEPRSEAVFALRAACLLFLAGVIALAVPGWLHGVNQKGRQVAWDVEIDPSLRRAAEQLSAWRAQGKLHQGEHSFAFHPDVACYCAWFGGEKSFLDTRLALFSRTIDGYVAICRDLDPTLAVPKAAGDHAASSDQSAGWNEAVLKDYRIVLVVLYDPDPARLLSQMSRLSRRLPREWQLLAVDGQAVIFRREQGGESKSLDPLGGLHFDPLTAAYSDPTSDGLQAPAAAPGVGPGRDPNEPGIGAFIGKPPPSTWESPAASVYLRLFEEGEGGRRAEAVDQYYTTAATGFAGLPGLPAAAGAPTGPMEYATSFLFRMAALDQVLADIDDRPPELPLLAVRAARRAVAVNPDDANAYLRLGQAYLALRDATMERSRGGALSPLALMRHIQIVTALRQALILNPDLEAAHQHLAILFMQRQFYDAALDHRRAEASLSRRIGPRPGEGAVLFKSRVDQMDKQVRDLEKLVQNAQDQFAIQSQPRGDDPLAKAQMAVRLGLGQQAVDAVLLQSRVELFGTAGAKLQLELMLMLGRAREAQVMLADADMKANKAKLTTFPIAFPSSSEAKAEYRFPAYEWLLACQEAALGDYDPADAALKDIGDALEAEEKNGRESFNKTLSVMLPFEMGAMAQARPVPMSLLLSGNRELETRQTFLQIERADVLVLRAMLALERGASADGERRLEESIAVSQPARELGADCPGRPLALAYIVRVRDRLR